MVVKEVDVRTHGWGGDPPSDDVQARRRILAVARTRLTEAGTTSTSEVAGLLGITRQTAYRYFPSTEDLLNAAAMDAVAELETDLVDHVSRYLAANGGDAGDAVVEVVAYVFEYLRDDAALNRLLAPGRIASTLSGLTAPSSIAIGRNLLERFPVDWERSGLDARYQNELVEHLLRTLQSLVLDPGTRPRSGPELRAYLNRWIAPALRTADIERPMAGSRV